MSYSKGTLFGIRNRPWHRTGKFLFLESDEDMLTRSFCRTMRELRLNN